MTYAEKFLAEIDAFLDRSKMSATAFSKGSVGDPNFVRDLRAGRVPSLALVERAHEFIRSQEANAA